MDYSQIKSYVASPEQELLSVKNSFEEHVSLAGKETYRPRIMFYTFFGEKLFGIASRPYVDQTDYLASIAEMMYSYPALGASSAIIVLDSNITKNKTIIGNCLNTYLISSDKAHAVTLPYEHSSDGKVIWKTNEETIKEVDSKNNLNMSSELLEISYAYSHIDEYPFNVPELLSYYSSMGFVFKAYRKLDYTYIDYGENKT